MCISSYVRMRCILCVCECVCVNECMLTLHILTPFGHSSISSSALLQVPLSQVLHSKLRHSVTEIFKCYRGHGIDVTSRDIGHSSTYLC